MTMETALQQLEDLAREESDGHYTICKFTTNFGVSLETPASREDIEDMIKGDSLEDAIALLVTRVSREKELMKANKKHEFANQLEAIILDNLEPSGMSFQVSKIKEIWKKHQPDISFKRPFTILFAKNRVGMLGIDTCEIRETWRTD